MKLSASKAPKGILSYKYGNGNQEDQIVLSKRVNLKKNKKKSGILKPVWTLVSAELSVTNGAVSEICGEFISLLVLLDTGLTYPTTVSNSWTSQHFQLTCGKPSVVKHRCWVCSWTIPHSWFFASQQLSQQVFCYAIFYKFWQSLLLVLNFCPQIVSWLSLVSWTVLRVVTHAGTSTQEPSCAFGAQSHYDMEIHHSL